MSTLPVDRAADSRALILEHPREVLSSLRANPKRACCRDQ